MDLASFSVDWDSPEPVYRQIAAAVQAAVRDGRLEPGDRLPATRDLARHLGVNRNTVVSAYDTLAEEGWVHGRTGRGTFLVSADEIPGSDVSVGSEGAFFTAFSRTAENAAASGLQSIYQLATSREQGIPFVGSYPAADLLPVESFRSAMSDTLLDHGTEVLGYGPTAGHAGFRQTVADAMRDRGSRISADRILVTNGAQQALELIFRAFVERGDAVIIEEPTYTGALSVLGALGARPIAVPVDDEGLRIDLFEVALRRHRPRLAYLQPTFQNPTGSVMGLARRRDVLELAARHACLIVEDDWAGDLRFDGEELPTLHALDESGRVLYFSTFSKKLMPGLRLGWAAAPPAVIATLIELKRVQDCGTSPLVQAALDTFLRRGGLAEHLERVIPEYRNRRDTMVAALERHMPDGVRWSRPQGGLFVWVALPQGVDGTDLFVTARRRGVLYSRGELFHSDGSGQNFMRLTYSAATPEQIEQGVATLGALVRERWPTETTQDPASTTESLPIF